MLHINSNVAQPKRKKRPHTFYSSSFLDTQLIDGLDLVKVNSYKRKFITQVDKSVFIKMIEFTKFFTPNFSEIMANG